MFYVMMTIANLGPLIFTYDMLYFSAGTIKRISGNKIYFNFAKVSSFCCQLSNFASAAGDAETVYLLMLLALERVLAISFPFRAHLFTLQRTAICCAILTLCVVGLNGVLFWAYDIILSSFNFYACSVIPAADNAAFAIFTIDYIIPNCLLLVITVLIFVVLKKSQMVRHGESFRSSEALKTVVTILVIAVVRCSVFVPFTLLYVSAPIVSNYVVSFSIRILANDFLNLTGLCEVLDFFVYFVLIPDFRMRVLKFRVRR